MVSASLTREEMVQVGEENEERAVKETKNEKGQKENNYEKVNYSD